jgi:hypothetical protein
MMKKIITAALAISALALTSCIGTAKKVVATTKVKPVNTAFEWSKRGEFAYLYLQAFDLAESKLDAISSEEDQAVCIDAPFLLIDPLATTRFFTEVVEPGTAFGIDELTEFSKNAYSERGIAFLRACSKKGLIVYLLAPEKQVKGIIADLLSMHIEVMSCMIEGEITPGSKAQNITLTELKNENRIGMILTTSLGEASGFTGMTDAMSDSVIELYKKVADKLILFPNPAFN